MGPPAAQLCLLLSPPIYSVAPHTHTLCSLTNVRRHRPASLFSSPSPCPIPCPHMVSPCCSLPSGRPGAPSTAPPQSCMHPCQVYLPCIYVITVTNPLCLWQLVSCLALPQPAYGCNSTISFELPTDAALCLGRCIACVTGSGRGLLSWAPTGTKAHCKFY